MSTGTIKSFGGQLIIFSLDPIQTLQIPLNCF